MAKQKKSVSKSGVSKSVDKLPTTPVSESAGFKSLKDSLSKPHKSSLSSMLNKGGLPEGRKMGGATQKQVGHNQTFGSDSSRAFVPRRTGG